MPFWFLVVETFGPHPRESMKTDVTQELTRMTKEQKNTKVNWKNKTQYTNYNFC